MTGSAELPWRGKAGSSASPRFLDFAHRSRLRLPFHPRPFPVPASAPLALPTPVLDPVTGLAIFPLAAIPDAPPMVRSPSLDGPRFNLERKMGTTEYTENTENTEAFEKAPVSPEGDAGLLQKPL